MPKINYKDIFFDSQLEVDYYQHLEQLQTSGEVVDFIYHPLQIPNLVYSRSYTPDFIVLYKGSRVEVVETKGWSQFSYKIDDQIHNAMKALSRSELRDYVNKNLDRFKNVKFRFNANGLEVVYRKLKHLKAYGWVDYEWKNPNTLANQRKIKIEELEQVLKAQNKKLKNCERYIDYILKIQDGQKITKQQREWCINFVKEFKSR